MRVNGARLVGKLGQSLWAALAFAPLAACSATSAPGGDADTPGNAEIVAKHESALVDSSSPVGTWSLRANGARLELTISQSAGIFSGTIKDEGGSPQTVSNISWDANTRWLEFRRDGSGFFQWYRMSLASGVVAGRFSHATAASKPALTSFSWHVTGWSPTYLDTATSPRTWQVTLNASYQGVLRIDKDSGGTLRGRLKVYENTAAAGLQEELEYDLSALSFNGTNLSFTRSDSGMTQVFTGTVSGRFISGTFTHNGGAPIPWSGTRAEVLGFGLGSRLSQRATWQDHTRARIVNLTEGMRANTTIPSVTVVEEPCVGCPFTGGAFPPERDDNPNAWPANYTLKRLHFSVQPGNRFDPAHLPPVREFYGYLATPTTAAPPGGYRVVVAVNGHGGSAEQLLTKSNVAFWHGESAARRNLAVLALDIGHRPEWGNAGPIVHNPIVGQGYSDSDWEEEGERAFSVRRAVDYLATVPGLRMDRLFIQGLSMGGEVTTLVGGLDPRFAMVMPAGYSPDMHVMDFYGNHPCYLWKYADIHEYLDISDYEALTAPRLLVVETGVADATFSPLSTPFSADKQVTRRARAAYGPDAAKLVHYLHYDAHAFHIGDFNPTNPSRPQGVTVPSTIEPTSAGDLTWQTSSSTVQRSPTLYHLMNETLL